MCQSYFYRPPTQFEIKQSLIKRICLDKSDLAYVIQCWEIIQKTFKYFAILDELIGLGLISRKTQAKSALFFPSIDLIFKSGDKFVTESLR